jgi:hypothetical protein
MSRGTHIGSMSHGLNMVDADQWQAGEVYGYSRIRSVYRATWIFRRVRWGLYTFFQADEPPTVRLPVRVGLPPLAILRLFEGSDWVWRLAMMA